jgi:hypothetical protein
MLKPSKLPPATNAVLASMFSELFPEEQVAIVSGDGSELSTMPFDHLVFTGSTAVGRAVMKAASENLVSVTLELGGKSLTIVAKGSVQNRTVSSIVWVKLLSGPRLSSFHKSRSLRTAQSCRNCLLQWRLEATPLSAPTLKIHRLTDRWFGTHIAFTT